VPPVEVPIKLSLPSLLSHASLPVVATVVVLLVASTAVWFVGVLKMLQAARSRSRAHAFEKRAREVHSADDLLGLVRRGDESAGARVLRAIASRGRHVDAARLRAAADRAIVDERQRARLLMPVLASTGAAAPFMGLFGTVYGIMDAFVRIGAAKSASLPVVAPAIGEALITTAIGLAAAIPAVLFYNAVDKQVSDFLAELEASAAEWIAILVADPRIVRSGTANASDADPA